MTRSGFSRCAMAAAVLLAMRMAALAHHSVSAEFDADKRFSLKGTLTKVDWVNPHIVVQIDVKQNDGAVRNWRFESNPPGWFRRVGVTRATFAKGLGQPVAVEANPAKDGLAYGYLVKIT